MKKDKEKEKEKKKKREKRPEEAAPAVQDAAAALEESPIPEEPGGAEALAHFLRVAGGKWKLRVLWALRSGKSLRYGEIKPQISGITDMMLSQSLKELTADGLLERRQFKEIPPRVEYRLSSPGKTLQPTLAALRQWELEQLK